MRARMRHRGDERIVRAQTRACPLDQPALSVAVVHDALIPLSCLLAWFCELSRLPFEVKFQVFAFLGLFAPDGIRLAAKIHDLLEVLALMMGASAGPPRELQGCLATLNTLLPRVFKRTYL